MSYSIILSIYADFDYRDFFTSISSRFLGKSCWFEEVKGPCVEKFVNEFTESGMCSYFNPDKNQLQTVEGPLGGLRWDTFENLYLFIHKYAARTSKNQNTKLSA